MGQDGFEVVVGFDDLEDWVAFVGKEVGVVREDSLGVAALYNHVN